MYKNLLLNTLKKKIDKLECDIKMVKKTFQKSKQVIQEKCKHNEIELNSNGDPRCTFCGYH